MKILYISLEGQIGGAEKSLLLTLSFIRQYEMLYCACPTDGGFSKEIAAMGLKWEEIPAAPKKKLRSVAWIFYMVILSVRLAAIAIRIKPDVVHANNAIAGFASILARVLTKAKLVVHVRDMPKQIWLYAILDLFSSRIIAISDFIKGNIEAIVGSEKVELVYNPAEQVENEHGFKCCKDGDSFVFANIGQFVPWKRQGLFIESAEILAKRNPNSRFAIIGDDVFGRNKAYKLSIIKRTEGSILQDKISVVGWQKNMDLVWDNIDCVVHTSKCEPFGRVVLEAIQNGVFVVASNSGGIKEITDETAAILIDSDDPNDYAQAMEEIMRRADSSKDSLLNAGKRVTEKFALRKTGDELLKIYMEAVKT